MKMSDMPVYQVIANGRVILEKGRLPFAGQPPVPERGNQTALLPQAELIEVIMHVATPLPRWLSWPTTIRVAPQSTLQRKEILESLSVTLILGGLFIIGIYHIALFLNTPSRPATLVFGAFCLVNTLRTAVSGSFDTLIYFLPHFPYELSFKLQLGGYYLAVSLFLSFLQLIFPDTVSRRLSRAVWALTAAFVLFVIITPVSTYGNVNPLFHGVTVITMAASIRSVILAFRRRIRGSKTMLAGCVILIAATANDLLYVENLPSIEPVVHFALFLFIVLQSLILSAQFSSAFAELAHTYKEFTKIVYLHTVKLIAKGLRIEQTMPTGDAEAVVIAFDIVGSSNIKHPFFSDAVERMMGRCYDAMSRGYDATHLECPAYRIKEMGDGLLCSVGFPFRTGSGDPDSRVALRLAETFARIFKEEMEKLMLPYDTYCAIGMAKGHVEGFFPRFGNKQYDLRGKTIMLATRYESMRNIVFAKLGRKGSLIFIQDDVYQTLPPEQQAGFQFWNTEISGQTIRDDGQARCAWYQFLPHASGVASSLSLAYPLSEISDAPHADKEVPTSA